MRSSWAVAAVLVAGCAAGSGPAAEVPGDDGAAALETSLEVHVGDTAVHLVYQVRNPTTQTIQLEFPTGQRYDFVVRRAGGDVVWRWSSDRMFTQAVGHESIAPGGVRRYEATWLPGTVRGEVEAEAWLTAQGTRAEARKRFEIRR